MFRAILFAHPQERKTVIYSKWYGIVWYGRMLLEQNPSHRTHSPIWGHIPHAVSQSLALLRMSKELPITC